MYSLAHKAGPKGEENQVVWGRRELWWIWSWFFKPHLYRIITCYSNRWSGGGVYSSLTPIDFLQLQSLLIVKLKKRLIFLFLIFHVMIYLLPLFRCFALCWGLLRHWGWGGGVCGGGQSWIIESLLILILHFPHFAGWLCATRLSLSFLIIIMHAFKERQNDIGSLEREWPTNSLPYLLCFRSPVFNCSSAAPSLRHMAEHCPHRPVLSLSLSLSPLRSKCFGAAWNWPRLDRRSGGRRGLCHFVSNHRPGEIPGQA